MSIKSNRAGFVSFLFLIFVSVCVVAGCGDDEDGPQFPPYYGVTTGTTTGPPVPVSHGDLKKLTISAANNATTVNKGETLQFSAQGEFADGFAGPVTDVVWTVVPAATNGVEATISNPGGLLTPGQFLGDVVVSAKSGTISSSNSITIQVREKPATPTGDTGGPKQPDPPKL